MNAFEAAKEVWWVYDLLSHHRLIDACCQEKGPLLNQAANKRSEVFESFSLKALPFK